MTITSADRDRYDETVEDYDPQHVPDSCLPTALKNILDELAERHDNSDIELSKKRIKDICEYREGLGSSAENVPAVLGSELEDEGYTAKAQINCSLGELERIVENGTCSKPLVELDPAYFDTIEDWTPQPDRSGYNFPHIVTVFKVNSEKILFHDPFGQMMVRSGATETPKQEMSKSQFYELWSGQSSPRWTLWVEQMEQQTLSAAIDNGE